MDVRPLVSDARFAAEIVDADIKQVAREVSGRDRVRLRDLLHQRLVLLFRAQVLSKDDLMAVGAIFGGTGEKDPWILEHRSHNYPDARYPHLRTVSADLTDP